MSGTTDADNALGALPEKTADKVVAAMENKLGTTMEEAEANLIRLAEEALAQHGQPLPGEEWYDDAGAEAREQARASGLDEEVGIAVTAVLSPGTEWGENVAHAKLVMDAVKSKDTPLTAQQIAEVNEWGSTPNNTTHKLNSSVQAEPGDTLATLYAKDAKLAGVMVAKDGNATAGYGYSSKFEKAVTLAMENDRSLLADGKTQSGSYLLGGAKVRSFYNNLSEPRNTGGDVTVDVHMMRAISSTVGKRDANWAAVADSATMSSMTSTPRHKGAAVGILPAAADSIRSATAKFNEAHGTSLLPHQFQAVTWVQQKATYPTTRVKNILSGGEVEVAAYTRDDGTKVEAYTKEAP